jgi:alpha-L-rhamnosidase
MGSRYLYGCLAEYDHGGVAMEILQQTYYPGIGHLFSRGATTFWESWGEKEIDENSAGVRSRNHPFQAGYDAWFFSGIGGIKPDPALPGFKRILMDPQLTDELSEARVSFQSIYGMIKSAWRTTGDDFLWHVSIPVNTTAWVHFPTVNQQAIFESDISIFDTEGAVFEGIVDGRAVFNIGSGDYSFMIKDHGHE